MKTIIAALSMSLVFYAGLAHAQTEKQAACAAPELCAVRTDKPPRMDGKLDESFWATNKFIDDFTVVGGDRKKDTTTKVKIAYDSEYIYLGIVCNEPGLASIWPKVNERDGWVGMDESIEIYVAPVNNDNVGFHYQLGFGGTKADEIILKRISNRQWNGEWLAAAHRSADYWSAEIALPRYVFAPYGDYRMPYINICRNRRIPKIDAQHVVVSEERRSSSMVPIAKSFWEPEKYPALKGMDSAPIKTPFLAAIGKLEVKPRYLASTQNMAYDIQATLTPKAASGEVALVITDLASGQSARHAEKLERMKAKEIIASVPQGDKLPGKIRVELFDTVNGMLFESREIDCSQVKALSGYWDRNYYTSEKSASFRYKLELDKKMLNGVFLAVLAPARSEALVRARVADTSGVILVPIESLQPGKHELTFQLVNNGGETLLKETSVLEKKPPAPGLEWKVDQFNRVLLNNGEPFFPIGFFVDVSYTPKTAIFEELRQNGFNFFMQGTRHNFPGNIQPEHAAKFAEIAEKYNLYFADVSDNYYSSNNAYMPSLKEIFPAEVAAKLTRELSEEERELKGTMMSYHNLPAQSKERIYRDCLAYNMPRILASVGYIKNSRRLAGYFLMDEPVEDFYFNQSAIARDYAEQIREADGGYHPIMTLYSSFIPPGDQYMQWADIVGTDPYWIPGNYINDRNTPNFVSWVTAMNDSRCDKLRKVTWSIPMATYWSATTTRLLTPDEQRAQTFLAVIYGAAGIIYYQSACLGAGDDVKQAVLDMGKELKKIAPAVVGPKVAAEIIYYEAALDAPDAKPNFERVTPEPEKNKFFAIQACLKRFPSGEYLLLAVNGKNYPVNAEFVFPGLNGEAQELVYGTKRPLVGNRFTEKLEKYAIRAYTLPNGIQEPCKVMINASYLKKDVRPPELGYRNSWREGRKNGFPNPIFAACAAPNRADYTFWGNGLNHEQALFGTNCVEIGGNGRVMFLCVPPIKSPEQYVFSAYLKANQPKATASFGVTTLSGYKWKEVEITDQWKRYYISALFAANSELYGSPIISGSPSNAASVKIWIDGVQIEKGSEPTEFEE